MHREMYSNLASEFIMFMVMETIHSWIAMFREQEYNIHGAVTVWRYTYNSPTSELMVKQAIHIAVFRDQE